MVGEGVRSLPPLIDKFVRNVDNIFLQTKLRKHQWITM